MSTSALLSCSAICKKSGNRCCNSAKVELSGQYYCKIHCRDKNARLIAASHSTREPDCCSICLSTIIPKTQMILGCGHIFHKDCLVGWIQQDKDTCPMCRQPMDVNSLIILHKSMLEYIGRMVFSLRDSHRELMLYILGQGNFRTP